MATKTVGVPLHVNVSYPAPLLLGSSPTDSVQSATVVQRQSPLTIALAKRDIKPLDPSASAVPSPGRQKTQSPLTVALAKRTEPDVVTPITTQKNQSPRSISHAQIDVSSPEEDSSDEAHLTSQKTQSPRTLGSDVRGIPIPAKRIQPQIPVQREVGGGKDRNGKGFAYVGRYMQPDPNGAARLLKSPEKDADREGIHRSDSSSSQLLAADSPPLGPKLLTGSDSLDHLFPLDEEVDGREEFLRNAEKTKAQRVYKHCMIRNAPPMPDLLSRSFP